MSSANDLAKMVPGFEFLQNLMKGASAGLPGVQGFGQWVAPTLDPAELDKRIQELKTVQFWLEQNARLLGGTIQALEVQRMTLATLQTMNLPMAELAESLRARPSAAPAPTPAPAPAAPSWSRPAPAAATPDEDSAHAGHTTAAGATPAAAKPAAIDPMQWWGALTQQFTEIAAQAVKEGSAAASAAAAAATPKASAPTDAVARAGSKAKAPASPGPAASNKPAGRKTAVRSPAKAAPRKRAT